jgi:hypothetical protein
MTTYYDMEFCPICNSNKQTSCRHRCNFCYAKLNDGWKNSDGQQIRNAKGKLIPHDEYGIIHNQCMRNGTGGRGYFKDKKIYVNEKSHDLHEYMKNMLRLANDGWWHGWRDGKYVGPIEKATKIDYANWEPEIKQ